MPTQPHGFVPLFTRHSRSWRRNRFVYPVISRRSRGLSIGVNLNPDKACNFDCVYCCVDRSQMPRGEDRPEVDLAVVEEELRHMLELAVSGEIFRDEPFDKTPTELQRLNDIAFSGDGEPTSFPRFGDACRLAARLIEEVVPADQPRPKIVVITNATLFHRPSVREALACLDTAHGEIWAKLDAGTEEYYRRVERTSVPLERVLRNIAEAGRIRPIVIQTLFMQLAGEGPPAAEIASYVDRLRDLRNAGCRIKLVQIYTVARAPAEAYVTPLPAAELDEIASTAAEAGFTVETYYGPE